MKFLKYLSTQDIVEIVKERKLIIANNLVYDITDYHTMHPGGKCILKNLVNDDGSYKDCHQDYKFHSKKSRKLWKSLCIGTISRSKFFI